MLVLHDHSFTFLLSSTERRPAHICFHLLFAYIHAYFYKPSIQVLVNYRWRKSAIRHRLINANKHVPRAFMSP